MPNPLSKVFRITLFSIGTAMLLSAISLTGFHFAGREDTTPSSPIDENITPALPRETHNTIFLKHAPEIPE